MVAGTVQGWRGGEVGMEPPGELEFQYPRPSACWSVAAAGLVAAWLFRVLALARGGRADDAVLPAVVLALLVGLWVYVILLRPRVRVRAEDVGLTRTGWAGDRRSMGWTSVSELWEVAWFEGPSLRRLIAYDGTGVAFPIGAGLVDMPLLREAVVQRAGLTGSARKWWGTACTRPTG